MINILLYTNCHGHIIEQFFKLDNLHKSYNINYIANFPISDNDNFKFNKEQLDIIKNTDIFIYNPMKNVYKSEKYINNVIKLLKKNCKLIKLSYYRFEGYYYNRDIVPYSSYNNLDFPKFKSSGLYNDTTLNYNMNIKNIKNYVDNIKIDFSKFNIHWSKCLIDFKKLDDESDIKIYDFFINNHCKYKLFHDFAHPTKYLLYYIYIKLTKLILNKEIIYNINNINNLVINNYNLYMQWSTPILDQIYNHLNLKFNQYPIYIFKTSLKISNIYIYYWLRLNKDNLVKFLNLKINL